MLHSLDDSEIYYNLKNLRPNRTEEEKEVDSIIKSFCDELGIKAPIV